MTNEERALNAEHAVAAFWGSQGEEELQTKIGDLLANLRHLCDREGISYDAADKAGRSHHACELIEEDGLAPDADEREAIRKADEAAANYIAEHIGRR